jgi:hypothetical protein
MRIAAKTVETIVDDDEGLSSLHVAWLDAGGYFSVARERGQDAIYCELNDQSQAFYSRTVRYAMSGRNVRFWVSGDEHFDGSGRIKDIEVVIPDGALDLEGISSCLRAIFGAAS